MRDPLFVFPLLQLVLCTSVCAKLYSVYVASLSFLDSSMSTLSLMYQLVGHLPLHILLPPMCTRSGPVSVSHIQQQVHLLRCTPNIHSDDTSCLTAIALLVVNQIVD